MRKPEEIAREVTDRSNIATNIAAECARAGMREALDEALRVLGESYDYHDASTRIRALKEGL